MTIDFGVTVNFQYTIVGKIPILHGKITFNWEGNNINVITIIFHHGSKESN